MLFTADDFAANTKVQFMKIAPGGRIKPHHHDIRTECIKIISGDGVIRINGQVAAASDDDIVLVQPSDVHEFINNSQSKPFTFLVIRTNDPPYEDMIFEND